MSALPQFNDLNRQVSAVESFLNNLEEKITSTYEQEELVNHTHTHTPRDRKPSTSIAAEVKAALISRLEVCSILSSLWPFFHLIIVHHV